MATTNEHDFPISSVESLHLSLLDSHLHGVIRSHWVNKRLHLATSMSSQIIALLDNIPVEGQQNPWLLSSQTIGLVFGLPKWKVQQIVKRKKKSDQGIQPSPQH